MASWATTSAVQPSRTYSSGSIFLQPPKRGKYGSNWRTFLAHYQDQIVACDFFTVETAWLKTLYVLFFIELGSRRVHVAGCTANPTSAWVTQQARQFSWQRQDGSVRLAS